MMVGEVMVAAGLFLAALDLGDERLDWWWLSLLLVVVGLVIWWLGPWVASPEQGARFSAVDQDIDAGKVPGGGAVASGDAKSSGGVLAPVGPLLQVEVYNHGDHWSCTERHLCETTGFCDRLISADEVRAWGNAERLRRFRGEDGR
ncbi:hypothetical protein [Microbacterium sp.]|uniref:hypothetical protein n=1 Tax=Microbacterium sp. TaxID=51671 RepID=UPI0039E5AB3F